MRGYLVGHVSNSAHAQVIVTGEAGLLHRGHRAGDAPPQHIEGKAHHRGGIAASVWLGVRGWRMRVTVVRPGGLGPSEASLWAMFQESSPTTLNPFLSLTLAQVLGRHRSDARIAHGSLSSWFPTYDRELGRYSPGAGALRLPEAARAAPKPAA